jgi:hypothetical protein
LACCSLMAMPMPAKPAPMMATRRCSDIMSLLV